MIISKTNRRFLRDTHGTVMCWKDNGVPKETLILDCEFRRYLNWFSDNVEIPGLQPSNQGYGYIIDTVASKSNPINSTQLALSEIATDQYLDSRLFYKDENTSKHNTDHISAKNSSKLIAASYCKSIDSCLPNIQTLVRIFCDGSVIDSLDPTIKYNSDMCLSVKSNGWFSSDIPFAWSSSEFDYYYAWTVLSTGLVGTVGKCDLVGGVIPVKELQ